VAEQLLRSFHEVLEDLGSMPRGSAALSSAGNAGAELVTDNDTACLGDDDVRGKSIGREGGEARSALDVPHAEGVAVELETTRPFGSAARGLLHGRVNICRRALREHGDGLRVRGVDRLEVVVSDRLHPPPIDEVPEAAPVSFQPGDRGRGALRSGAVVERLEDLGDLHG
jgi:hypothetical protein